MDSSRAPSFRGMSPASFLAAPLSPPCVRLRAQKKMDIQEAMVGTESWVPRTLRFFVSSSNTRDGNAQDQAKSKGGEALPGREEPKAGEASASEVAAGAGAGRPWRLQVYARILEGSPLDPTSALGAASSEREGEGSAADGARASLIESTLTSAFMQNVKRLEIKVGEATVEAEPGTEGGGGNRVVWMPNRLLDSGEARKDGANGAEAVEVAPPLVKAGAEALAGGALVISGHAKEDFVAEVKVEMQGRPERFRLATELQQLLGLEVDTRPRILQALWHYIKANRLQVCYLVACERYDTTSVSFNHQLLQSLSLRSHVISSLRHSGRAISTSDLVSLSLRCGTSPAGPQGTRLCDLR